MQCVEFFFPEHPIEPDNVEAKKFRRIITLITVGHLVLGILNLIFADLGTFLFQWVYIFILYSYYMTLKPWTVYVYAVLLILNVVTGIFSLIFFDSLEQFIVYGLTLGFFCGVLVLLNKKLRFINDIKGSRFGGGLNHMLSSARGNDRENTRNQTSNYRND